jgi:SagB-type dehydrogenase family enzyme
MNESLWRSAQLVDDDHVWLLFHENSKLPQSQPPLPDEEVARLMGRHYQSLPYDGYPNFPLSSPCLPHSLSLHDSLITRTSFREFNAMPVSFSHASTLLYYAYGARKCDNNNERDHRDRDHRMVPSAGGLYPLELYLINLTIPDLPPGVFHYNPIDRSLRFLSPSVDSESVQSAFVQGGLVKASSGVIIITAVFRRICFKYYERGYRFAFLEAGHVAQNVCLVSSALGVGCLPIGGFYDRCLDELLGIDGIFHSSLYALAIGGREQREFRGHHT